MARSSLKAISKLLDNRNENIPIEERFLNDLISSIEHSDYEDMKQPSRTYKPSSMNCIRNMYYQVIGSEQDKSIGSYVLKGICDSGTDIHERIQGHISRMKDNNINCEYCNVEEYIKSRNLDIEVKSKQGMEYKLYSSKYNVSFMCDGIIRYNNRYYIVEIKTETCNKFYKRSGVDEKHHTQGTAYSTLLDIDEVIFIYVSRDNLQMKSYMYKPSAEDKKVFINRILKCDKHIELKEVPPKPENASTKLCQYCNYKCRCEEDI